MISVILVQHNAIDLTRHSISSLRKFHPAGCEIILVDNASEESGLDQLLHDFPEIRVVRNKQNVGFGRANNQASKIAQGSILFFLNNDTVTTQPFLQMVEDLFAGDRTIGIVGLKLLNADHTFQLSAGGLPTIAREVVDKIIAHLLRNGNRVMSNIMERQYRFERSVGWVTGAAMFIRKDIFLSVGGFEEEMFMYFEDKDLCLKVAQRGYAVRYIPQHSLVHLKAGSSTDSLIDSECVYRQSQICYYRRHRPRVERLLLRLYLSLTGKHPGKSQ